MYLKIILYYTILKMTTKETTNVNAEVMVEDHKKLTFKEKVKTQTNKIVDLFNLKNIHEKLIKPKAKALWMLSYVEVLWLMHAEEGLEMFPFDMYQGTMKWTIEFNGDVPMMKRLKHIQARGYFDDRAVFFGSHQRLIDEIVNRWYITASEILFFRKKQMELKCDFIIEKVPAVFIIADKNAKNRETIPQIKNQEAQKDPIVLIKYGDDKYFPVHSRDNSRQLDAKLAKLN